MPETSSYARVVRRLILLAAVLGGAVAIGTSLAASPQSVRLVRLAGGFERPVLATQAPGEPRRVYVVEQPGRIRVVENGGVRAFLDKRPPNWSGR